MSTICQKAVKHWSKFCDIGSGPLERKKKIGGSKKNHKNCHKKIIYIYIYKMKISCQKVVKKLQKLQKLLGKSCQKVVKRLSKFCYIGKGSGEDEDDEEDWWLLDQVATWSHLVKMADLCCGLIVVWR
jgi:hypothetical protein